MAELLLLAKLYLLGLVLTLLFLCKESPPWRESSAGTGTRLFLWLLVLSVGWPEVLHSRIMWSDWMQDQIDREQSEQD